MPTTPTAPLVPGQLLAARYELVRPLRAGAVGDDAPWLARDRETGREVVLKRLAVATGVDASGAPDRSQVEQVLRGLSHPSLLLRTEQCMDGDSSFDVYCYLPGGEIGRLRGRPWPLIVRRLLPVVEALGALHAAGIAHGDIKSANILLDGNGFAHLADFGSSQALTAPGRVPGSPYSLSPERHLDGRVSVADDVYATGVLLYELISGHPPFYPDITPQRVRDETPPLLTGRPEPGPALRALVAACLAKHPDDRPAGMPEVHAQLTEALAEADTVEPPGARVEVAHALQPPPDATPIRPQWRRTGAEGPSVEQLRREGFRRGLLASAVILAVVAIGFTFFVLPDLVARRAARGAEHLQAGNVAAATQATAPAAAALPDLERLAELKRRAEEIRAPLPQRLQALEQFDAARWGAALLAQARTALAAGDAQMEKREFQAAINEFTALADALGRLEKQRPQVLQDELRAARTAFDAGRSVEAAEKFASALRIDPANAAARTGLARSKVLDAATREVTLGARAEQQGDAAGAAAAYKRALGLDPATSAAHEGLARLQSRATGDAFSAAVAQAQSALARKDMQGAEAAFRRADKIRPGTSEVADGLQQVRLASETQGLALILARARTAEREERWADAVAAYREALKTDSTLREAQEGLERSEPRAMLYAQLQAYIDRPERLYSQAGREAARSALALAASSGASGTRLQEQVARVTELVRQAETPVHVALASDNATEVQVYRVGKLGLFDKRELELMPGRYTVVGTRQGYRDVRKEIMLLPGIVPPPLTIRCEEPI